MEFGFGQQENIFGKRRKCCLPAFSPFSQNIVTPSWTRQTDGRTDLLSRRQG